MRTPLLALLALTACSCAESPATAPPPTSHPGDFGFNVTPDGIPIHWDREDLPILLEVHPTAAPWYFHVQKAALIWNHALGREIIRFSPDIHPEAEVFTSTAVPNPGVVPIFGFAPCPENTIITCNPHTSFAVSTETGRFITASIHLPLEMGTLLAPDSVWLVVHEIGHALGLGHDVMEQGPDRKQWSIMLPLFFMPFDRDPPPITRLDRQRLRALYFGEPYE